MAENIENKNLEVSETVENEEKNLTDKQENKTEKKVSVKEFAERPKKFKRQGRKKVCAFCVDKSNQIDYKDSAKLKHFITEKGKILPRCQTGTCSMHQRMLAKAIKRARNMAILPYKAD